MCGRRVLGAAQSQEYAAFRGIRHLRQYKLAKIPLARGNSGSGVRCIPGNPALAAVQAS